MAKGSIASCASTRPDLTESPISGGRKTKQNKKSIDAILDIFV